MDCHPTFGISLLEKHKPGHRDQPQDPPPRIEIDSHGYERFIPEHILDAKFENNDYFYLIKWEGYSDEHNTWEPIRLIRHRRIFQQFKRQHPEHAFPPASRRTIARRSSLLGREVVLRTDVAFATMIGHGDDW